MARTVIEWEGAEAVEETGYGRIAKVDHDGGRNAQVTINAEHLAEPVSGWVDTSWLPTWGPVNEFYARDCRIWYRVVVHRKAKVDKAIAFADLGKHDKVRDMVELKEAPAPRGRAAAANGATAVAEAAPPAQVAPPAPPAAETTPSAPPAAPGPPDAPPARRGRVQEARPWEPLNTDGSPNFGSYEFAAALGMLELAQDLWLKGHPGEPVTDDVRVDIARLGRRLLLVADAAQAHVRHDGKSDRLDNSHVRARGAVRSAVEALPVPWLAETNERAVWVSALERHACWLLDAAVELAGLR